MAKGSFPEELIVQAGTAGEDEGEEQKRGSGAQPASPISWLNLHSSHQRRHVQDIKKEG